MSTTESTGGAEERVENVAERFLSELRAGRSPDREAVLRENPSIEGALRRRLGVIEALHGAGGEMKTTYQADLTNRLPRPGPRQLGEYEILDEIGRGGMGVVFRARQPRLDRIVAVKTIQSLDRGGRERFLREARLGASLSHPGIVQVHEIGEDGDTLFIVQEFVEGSSLADHIRALGALPEPLALELVRQAAVALQYAHEQGIVHRDVKPANLLVDARGRVKVVDLGLARRDAEGDPTLTRSGAVLGSVAYMSPEQFEDPRQADFHSDIYSLGATLYHALTGRLPFEGKSALSIAGLHATCDRPDPRSVVPAVTPRAAALARKMMAIRPSDRFDSWAEAIRAIEGEIRVRPPMSRSRRRTAAIACLALLLAGAAALWTIRRPAPPSDPAPTDPPSAPRAVRLVFEFEDAADLADWEAAPDVEAFLPDVSVHDGALWIDDKDSVKECLVRLRQDLRVTRVRIVAACTSWREMCPHINVYLNTRWSRHWVGNWGVACIFRDPGRALSVDREPWPENDAPPPCRLDVVYDQTITLDAQGRLVWTIDGANELERTLPSIAGRSGSVLIGTYGGDVRIERVEIEGEQSP